MSDSYFILIAEDPNFVPAAEKLAEAKELLKQIAVDAEELEIADSEELEFFDCAENFERITCPTCNAEIEMDWFWEQMEEGFLDEDLQLNIYSLPCCQTEHTLHELKCEMPQGFGRFSLQAMNPSIDEIEPQDKAELEKVIGTKLRVIYQQI